MNKGCFCLCSYVAYGYKNDVHHWQCMISVIFQKDMCSLHNTSPKSSQNAALIHLRNASILHPFIYKLRIILYTKITLRVCNQWYVTCVKDIFQTFPNPPGFCVKRKLNKVIICPIDSTQLLIFIFRAISSEAKISIPFNIFNGIFSFFNTMRSRSKAV